jgi:hypothetical protein
MIGCTSIPAISIEKNLSIISFYAVSVILRPSRKELLSKCFQNSKTEELAYFSFFFIKNICFKP